MSNPKPPATGSTPAPEPTPRADQSSVVPLPPQPERIDLRLLELLVCPVTKTTLSYDANAQELISRAARLAFPIKNGVALLTVDAARELED
jgi:uncharacterized protein